MNVLLIYPQPDQNKNARFGFSYELLTIATILQSYYGVTIKDYSCEEYDVQWLRKKINSGFFDVALIECDSFALKRSQNLVHARELMTLFKDHIPTIAYGNYCYITKIDFKGADFTVKNNDINMLIAQINALVGTSNRIPTIMNYDSLPYIDRELLMTVDYYRKNSHSTLLQTSKGCENSCVFCQRKGWQNSYIAHSDEYVLGEFQYLQAHGYANIWIMDENFTFNLPRAKTLLRKLYKQSLTTNMNLFISSWVNIDSAFVDLAACCNVKIISFGIESASDEILAFYRKNIKLDKASEIIQYTNGKGIFTVGNFILGAPMETEETVEKTFEFIRNCQFDQVNIKILDYMVGSELYDTLPNSLKARDHIFACSENGLTKMKLIEMVQKKTDFQRKYYSEHKAEIAEKIKLYGNPYLL